MPRSSVRRLAFSLFVVGAALLGWLALSGCSALDGYERSYSLEWTEGGRTIAGGVTLRQRGDGKTMRPPNGPATAQQYHPGHGWNFGGPSK